MILAQEDFVKHKGEHLFTTASNCVNIQLLQAVARYKDDWERIGEEVGKSPAECMWEFAKAPINEVADGKLALRAKESTSSLCDLNNPLLAEVARSIEGKEIHGAKVHDVLSQELGAVNNRIQQYEEALEAIDLAKESLAVLEKSIETANSEYLLQRINTARAHKIQETPKLFIVKAPKFARIN